VLGLVLVTTGAAFSTGSVINSTLFATARLTRKVSESGELPSALQHTNRSGIPDRAVVGLGALAALLAAVGSLGVLVEAASPAFLFTFAVVRLSRTDPLALAHLGLLAVLAAVGRPFLLRRLGAARP
jgi:hypothetical protein